MKSLKSYLLLMSLLVAIFLAYQKLNKRLEGEEREKVGEADQYREMATDDLRGYGDDRVAEARSTTRKHPARKKIKRIRTDSGLIYEVLREGRGARPGPNDKVKVLYRGYLQSGEEFDRTVGDRPMSFPLDIVIKGWSEGLQLMKVGAKYRFVIPSELAYGARGAPPKIGPNETLIFEVELVGIDE